MQNYVWFDTVRKTTVAFLDLFNDIVVKRYDDSDVAQETIEVPIKFWPAEKTMSRILASETNQDTVTGLPPSEQPVVLPIMSAILTGIEARPEDKHGLFENVYITIEYDADGKLDYVKKTYQAMPWNMTYEMSVWTRKAGDLFQILENILPNFSTPPSIAYRQQGLSLERDLKVTLDSQSLSFPTELEIDTNRRFAETNLSFTVEGWLYKPIAVQGIIKTVIVNVLEYDGANRDGGTTITITGEELITGEQTITETVAEYSA